MALIILSGRKDPIEVTNDRARMIKARWSGVGGMKASSEDLVDLDWISFRYGQIKSIEMQKETKERDVEFTRPLTEQEKRDRAVMMARIRKNLEDQGILQKKNMLEHYE